MKKKEIIYSLIAALFLIAYNTSFSGEIADKVISTIRMEFGDEVDIVKKKALLPKKIKRTIEKSVRQKFLKDYIYTYIIKNKEATIGYGLLDNVFGKAQPITFLVLFDNKGNIISSHVVKYREPYGGEVRNHKWLKQFTGKSDSSSFKVGKDIDAISGATISTKAVSKGINRLAKLIKDMIANNEY